MQAGPRDNRTFARRAAGQAKKGVRSAVQALPRRVRERIAGLVLPAGPGGAAAPPDDAELIRRAAAVPF